MMYFKFIPEMFSYITHTIVPMGDVVSSTTYTWWQAPFLNLPHSNVFWKSGDERSGNFQNGAILQKCQNIMLFKALDLKSYDFCCNLYVFV